ncbi:MAG TPA: hypothetical protein VED46_16075 [Alphaproteobacteria bacterium]|jgi:hypothetical protein|nr:hypothetical protein [Alphaproteobacteria bacterium]
MPKPDPITAPPASAQDVTDIIGPAEERLVLDILATKATVPEVSAAYHWLTADDHLGGDLAKPMTGRVRSVYELLKADLEPPEEER